MTTLWRRPTNLGLEKSVVAIGNFDGVHIGHQTILQQTVQLAQQQQATPVLLTFDPYPQAFFHPEQAIARLTTLREKTYLAQSIGVTTIYALPFNQILAHYSAQQFIDEILIKQLHACTVIVGNDFRFGFQRSGDVTLLQNQKTFTTHIANDVLHQQRRVSSSWVRESLSEGNLHLAKQLLHRDYSIIGRVVHGDKRGRQLGFPTANIALTHRLPAVRGVFVVSIRNETLPLHYGVANVGVRPTVDGVRAFLEVFIFDFNADIYGQLLDVCFLHKLRDEQRFNSLEGLKAQIAQDVEMGRALRPH